MVLDGSWWCLLGGWIPRRWMGDNHEAVAPSSGGGIVVMAPDQFGDSGDQFLGEPGAGLRRPEPDLGIDGKGGEPFSGFGRAAQ